jgi:uncharacterized protein YdeI (YjbR/CyaY-like superfamily)
VAEPIYFASPEEFRDWLSRHHATERELLVGFHKKGSGRPSMTWPESVDEALCFGWIDGVRRSVDEERYTIRFTPRKRASIWSNVNIRRAEALIASGRMQPAGQQAFDSRTADRSGVYSFEQRTEASLSPEMIARLQDHPEAWRFWEAQPAGYRRTATWWVISAKQEATRLRRLDTLIADCAAGRRVAPLRRKGE